MPVPRTEILDFRGPDPSRIFVVKGWNSQVRNGTFLKR